MKAGETQKINQEGRVYLALQTEENLKVYFELYALGFYERTIYQADLFLNSYSGSSFLRFSFRGLFLLLREFLRCYSSLSSVVDSYPDSEFSDDAQYLLAKSFSEG